jgi:hypothetical protein
MSGMHVDIPLLVIFTDVRQKNLKLGHCNFGCVLQE